MKMYSLTPPILEITYDELMLMDDPDAEMAQFMDDAVAGYVSWLEG